MVESQNGDLHVALINGMTQVIEKRDKRIWYVDQKNWNQVVEMHNAIHNDTHRKKEWGASDWISHLRTCGWEAFLSYFVSISPMCVVASCRICSLVVG